MTDGNSEEVTHGGSEEDAVWRELIGRFDAPAYAADGPAPWPERENLAAPAPAAPAPAAPAASGPAADSPAAPVSAADSPAASVPAGDSPAAPAAPPESPVAAAAAPESPGTIRPEDSASGRPPGPRTWSVAPAAEDEHYIPPPPPPLPALSPATKGAWAGLFGGPGYLLVATLVGWSVPGWALFCAVAAFIAGFTVLVLHLGDESDRDQGPDDGAVV